jgi:hypothetical protein
MNVGAWLATRSDIKNRKAVSVLESRSGRKALFAALSHAQGAAMSALTAKFAGLRAALRREAAGACRAQTDIEETAIMQDYALRLAAVCVTTPYHLRAAAIRALIAARTAALIELRHRARQREAAQSGAAVAPLNAAYQAERHALARAFAQSREALRAPQSAHHRRVQLLARYQRARPLVTGRQVTGRVASTPIRPRTGAFARRGPHPLSRR